jgi:hypothetical protein
LIRISGINPTPTGRGTNKHDSDMEHEAMIAKGKYVRGGDRKAASSHLNAHFKYIEHRPRDLARELRDDRRLFNKDRDSVDRKAAVDDVMEHSSSRVSYHKIVLSPAEDEPVLDWRQWTRDVMADLEEMQGKELRWYAAHHENTDHPHVHVVVAGAGYDRETGERETVKLFRQDYEQLRESGHDHSEYAWEHRLEELFQDLERQDSGIEDIVAHGRRSERFNDLERGEMDR